MWDGRFVIVIVGGKACLLRKGWKLRRQRSAAVPLNQRQKPLSVSGRHDSVLAANILILARMTMDGHDLGDGQYL